MGKIEAGAACSEAVRVTRMLAAAGVDAGGADIGELVTLLALLRAHRQAMTERDEAQRRREALAAQAARSIGRKPARALRDPWQRLEAARAQERAAVREIEARTREAAAAHGADASAIDAAMKGELGAVRDGLRAVDDLLPRRPRPQTWANDAVAVFTALCGVTGEATLSREGPAARFIVEAVALVGWPRPTLAAVEKAIRQRRATATKSS